MPVVPYNPKRTRCKIIPIAGIGPDTSCLYMAHVRTPAPHTVDVFRRNPWCVSTTVTASDRDFDVLVASFRCSQVFVAPASDGTCLLLRVAAQKTRFRYVFVGTALFGFDTTEKILRFIAPKDVACAMQPCASSNHAEYHLRDREVVTWSPEASVHRMRNVNPIRELSYRW